MNQAARIVADWIQILNLAMALAMLVLSIAAGRRWPRGRAYVVGPATYAAHSVVFYIFALSGVMSGPWPSLWSAALRFHGYVFLLGTMVAFYAVAISPIAPESENGMGHGDH